MFNKYRNSSNCIGLQAYQNNFGFSLCTALSICYLVVTSEVEIEFKRGSSNRKKCVFLTPEFSVNSDKQKLWSIIRLEITEYLLVLK